MDFDRAQQILEALQIRCPHTDKPEVDAWTRAITRARGVGPAANRGRYGRSRDGESGAVSGQLRSVSHRQAEPRLHHQRRHRSHNQLHLLVATLVCRLKTFTDNCLCPRKAGSLATEAAMTTPWRYSQIVAGTNAKTNWVH